MINVTGIVLSSVTLNEKKNIYTIFTKEFGKISLSAYMKKGGAIAVLSIYEFTVKPPIHSEIYSAKEWSLQSPLLGLREGFSLLQYAQKMCLSISKSQCDRVEKPHLYYLLRFFLVHLPKLNTPEHGLYCFYAKLLHAEGVLNLNEIEIAELVQAKTLDQLNALKISGETQKNLSDQIENNFF